MFAIVGPWLSILTRLHEDVLVDYLTVGQGEGRLDTGRGEQPRELQGVGGATFVRNSSISVFLPGWSSTRFFTHFTVFLLQRRTFCYVVTLLSVCSREYNLICGGPTGATPVK